MSRAEISFSRYNRYNREYKEYNDRCGQTLEYFADLVYEDYKKCGKAGLNSVTLDQWIARRCYEKFGISPLDAISIVNQAKSDGYMRWVREKIRECMGRTV